MSHRLLLAALLLAAPSAASAQGDWRLIRPTNTGILGDYVQAIHVDGADRPWIAAYTTFWEEGGMSRLEPDGSFTVLSSVEQPAISSPRFNDIAREPGGRLWIATRDGLLRYDPDQGPSSLVRYDALNAPLPGSQIAGVDLAPDGTVWLAVHNVSGPNQGGLARYTPSTDSWQVWTSQLTWGGGWPGWTAVSHVAVRPDASGSNYTVWFGSPHNLGMGTWRDGVFTWLGNPQSPPSGRYPMSFLSQDPIDAQGNLWVLTNQGLMRQDAGGGELVVGYPAGLSTEVSRVVALDGGRAALGTYYAEVFVWNGGWSSLGNWGSGNHTYALTEDSTGALWAGGIGGAAKYSNGAWQRYRLSNTGMLSFFMDALDIAPDGRVFMSANAAPGVGGFDILDGERWLNANDHTYGLGLAWGLPSDNTTSLCARASGNLALAPGGIQGLLEWDGASYTYLMPQGYDFVAVEEDGLERLWAARYGNAGVHRIGGAQNDHYTASNSPLPGGSIGSIEPDPADDAFVWITTQFGVARTSGDTWTLYPRELLGLTQNTTAHLLSAAAPHPDGSVWIGSFSGLYRFDPATSTYTQYTKDNSALPSNEVRRVHVAPDGSVWAATFDTFWPYPGGLTHFQGGGSAHYQTSNSPLPHNQIETLDSRPVTGGYELWIGTASEAVAVIRVTDEGQAFCFGDGSGSPCPCGNQGAPGRGCANGSSAGGALLTATGAPSVAGGGLTLRGAGLAPNQPGLYFQGDNAVNGGAGALFGDGLRCAGGNVRRLQVVTATGGGLSATSADIALRGGAQPGDLRRYQLWYRDPLGSVCGSGFNLTNGLELVWEP